MFVRKESQFAWLASFLTVNQLVALLPDIDGFRIDRYVFPNLWAINFEIFGVLEEGVASALRPDPQAKGLGEYLRSVTAEIPVEFV